MRQQAGVVEGEDAFDEDNAGGDEGVGAAGDAGVGAEVVDRALDGLAGGEGADVLEDEFGLEGVRVVEVLEVAIVEGEVGEVAVVEVEGEEGGVELGSKLASESSFAGSGAASDSDDEGALGGFGLDGF